LLNRGGVGSGVKSKERLADELACRIAQNPGEIVVYEQELACGRGYREQLPRS
jgi:hypothetical protein